MDSQNQSNDANMSLADIEAERDSFLLEATKEKD